MQQRPRKHVTETTEDAAETTDETADNMTLQDDLDLDLYLPSNDAEGLIINERKGQLRFLSELDLRPVHLEHSTVFDTGRQSPFMATRGRYARLFRSVSRNHGERPKSRFIHGRTSEHLLSFIKNAFASIIEAYSVHFNARSTLLTRGMVTFVVIYKIASPAK